MATSFFCPFSASGSSPIPRHSKGAARIHAPLINVFDRTIVRFAANDMARMGCHYEDVGMELD